MCRRTTCKTCKKPTWAGCGAHIEQVLGDVPRAERCTCREAGTRPKADRSAAGEPAKRSLLQKLGLR